METGNRKKNLLIERRLADCRLQYAHIHLAIALGKATDQFLFLKFPICNLCLHISLNTLVASVLEVLAGLRILWQLEEASSGLGLRADDALKLGRSVLLLRCRCRLSCFLLDLCLGFDDSASLDTRRSPRRCFRCRYGTSLPSGPASRLGSKGAFRDRFGGRAFFKHNWVAT